jgi:hypothetical protein
VPWIAFANCICWSGRKSFAEGGKLQGSVWADEAELHGLERAQVQATRIAELAGSVL